MERIQTEMAESKSVQSVVNQVAIQATTAVMRLLKDADAGLRSATNAASPRE